jgi:hypothetical protein
MEAGNFAVGATTLDGALRGPDGRLERIDLGILTFEIDDRPGLQQQPLDSLQLAGGQTPLDSASGHPNAL